MFTDTFSLQPSSLLLLVHCLTYLHITATNFKSVDSMRTTRTVKIAP